MSKVVVGLSVVLVASLAVNAYLLLGRSSVVQPSARPSSSPPTTPSDRAASPKDMKASVVRAARKRYVDLDRDALELRLVEAEAKVNALLPPNQRFALETRIPEHEHRVRSFFDTTFGPGTYELECRETACRVVPTTDANDDWMAAMQSHPDAHTLFAGMMFGGGESFVTLMDSDKVAGAKLLGRAANAVFASDAVARCKKDHATVAGTLKLELGFDATKRVITAFVTGRPALQPAADCLQVAALAAVSAIAIPSDVVDAAPIMLPISVP